MKRLGTSLAAGGLLLLPLTIAPTLQAHADDLNVITIPIGITWTSRASAADLSWNSVTYGNGLFVAVSSTGTGNRVMTSPDGITWTSRAPAGDKDWRSVTYGNGLFVAVSDESSGHNVMTSPDGITWTGRTSAANNDWNSVTYANGLFVAVSNSGTGNRVMTSGVNYVPGTVLQQFGRPSSGTCDAAAPTSLNWGGVPSGGWGASWAQWMNSGTGGPVCTRTINYSTSQSRWVIG